MMPLGSVANTPVAPLTVLATTSSGEQIEVSAQGTSANSWWLGSNGTKYRMNEEGLLESRILTANSALVMSSAESGQSPINFFPQSIVSDTPFRQPMLVLLLSFTDRAISTTLDELSDRIFTSQNSVASYYQDLSGGDFQIQPVAETQGVADGIVHLSLPQIHPDFGSHYQQAAPSLVRQALLASANWVDYPSFDSNQDGVLSNQELAVVVIVAGFENAYGGQAASHPRVWAHQGDTGQVRVQGKLIPQYALFGELHQNHVVSIGIICHELGHLLLGLPDLYDRNGQSYGIGRWGLMGTGSWNRTGAYLGDSPAGMMAWSKNKAGFQQSQTIDQEGQYELMPGQSMQLWLDPYQHGEHFLLEYRQQQGLDKGLPMQGLLISHIDPFRESQQNDEVSHKLVDIESADGQKDLDARINQGDSGDPWPGIAFNREFTSQTVPSATSYYTNSLSIKLQNIRDQQTHVSFYLTPQSRIKGTHVGYDEAGINGHWHSGSSVAGIAQLITNDTRYDSLDGVDFYASDAAQVNLRVYDRLQQGQPEKILMQEKGFVVNAGWNRLLLSTGLYFSPGSSLVIETEVVSKNAEVRIAADFMGQASGRSLKKASMDQTYEFADFDISQHLLLSDSDSGSVLASGLFPASSKVNPSTGGGGMLFMFLFYPLLVLLRTSVTLFRYQDRH